MRHKKKRYGFGLGKDGTGKGGSMAPGARRMKRMSKRKMRSRG